MMTIVATIVISIFYISYPRINPSFLVISGAAILMVYRYISTLEYSGFKKERAKLVKQTLRALYFSVQISIILAFYAAVAF